MVKHQKVSKYYENDCLVKLVHILSTSNDPKYSVKIPFAEDQLTRVRFAGAKDLLAVAHTPADRFEHCSPFTPVMFHTKTSFLQYCYSLLYHRESANQVGPLKYFREKLNRKNVTPNKILDSYDGCEELFVSVEKAYFTVALMNFFKMESIDDYPTAHCFENNVIQRPHETRKQYFDDKVILSTTIYSRVTKAHPVVWKNIL